MIGMHRVPKIYGVLSSDGSHLRQRCISVGGVTTRCSKYPLKQPEELLANSLRLANSECFSEMGDAASTHAGRARAWLPS